MEITNSLGRRKKAVARVYLKEGTGQITVNKKDFKTYFPTGILQFIAQQAFELTDTVGKYDVVANLDGGGINGQAEALRLGISRALVKIDEENKPALKAKGLMTRDSRSVERKKFGHKKARKSYQFSKR
mgnify:FL=1